MSLKNSFGTELTWLDLGWSWLKGGQKMMTDLAQAKLFYPWAQGRLQMPSSYGGPDSIARITGVSGAQSGAKQLAISHGKTLTPWVIPGRMVTSPNLGRQHPHQM